MPMGRRGKATCCRSSGWPGSTLGLPSPAGLSWLRRSCSSRSSLCSSGPTLQTSVLVCRHPPAHNAARMGSACGSRAASSPLPWFCLRARIGAPLPPAPPPSARAARQGSTRAGWGGSGRGGGGGARQAALSNPLPPLPSPASSSGDQSGYAGRPRAVLRPPPLAAAGGRTSGQSLCASICVHMASNCA